MARRYAVSGNATNTATKVLGSINSTTAIRPRIYDIVVGSDAAPADQASKFQIVRTTDSGTAGTAVTPQALDPADPAATATAKQGTYTTDPAQTANAFLLQWSQNQRATFRWVAAPASEIVLPNSTSGIALVCPATTSAVNHTFCFEYEE